MPQSLTVNLSDLKPVSENDSQNPKALKVNLSDLKPFSPDAKTAPQQPGSQLQKPPQAPQTLPSTVHVSQLEQTPQQKILKAATDQGYSPEDAQRRVNEYDYAIKQGLSPERAEQFASGLQLKAQKKVLSQQEIQQVADWYGAIPLEDRQKGGIGRVTNPQEFAQGYAEAKALGMDDSEAQEYGRSQPFVRAGMRATKWSGDRWSNAEQGMLRLLGGRDEKSHVKAEDAVEGSLIPSLLGQTRQDWELNRFREVDWIDKHYGKTLGTLQKHIDNLITGFTTPDMAAIELASLGTGTVESLLPEVGAEATAGAKATRFAQRAVRTTSKLAHIGFTSQMAQGTVESGSEAVRQWGLGNKSEAAGYALDALVNGVMAGSGMRSIDAHAEVRNALDNKSTEVLGKKFGKLSDQQQALMIERLIEDDPEFQKAADASEKQAQKAARKLQHRYSEAVGQAWNPNAAQRALKAIHAEKAETARKSGIQAIADTIKAHVERERQESQLYADRRSEQESDQERERQEGIQQRRRDERIAAVRNRAEEQRTAEATTKAREQTFADRQAVGEIPTDEQTSRHVEATVDDTGHVRYPVEYWGETNHFGVSTDGERHPVYRQTPRGVEWLDRNGNFTETPESLYWNADPQVSDTVARLSALKLEADGAAAQPNATAEQIKDAETLGDIRRQLLDGEISASDAQKQVGIAEKAQLPDEFLAAREGRLNGPFHEKSAADYTREMEDGLREAGTSEEEIQATLESLPEVARAQVESNLHHVYQPGDYIISKRGVKWTLDSRGLLHSSDGEVVPLMKRGTYSNQALQLAASGRVGYGQMTRQERRAKFAQDREIRNQIRSRQDEFDREMRLAQQNAGLESAGVIEPSARETERGERATKFLGRHPVPDEIRRAREARKAAYKASADPNNVINQLAKQYGVSTDEIMRIGLSESVPGTPAGKAASLEVGDRISDPFKKSPWIVEEKDGRYQIRNGQANPLPFDRLNPSPRVLQILERGEITHDRDWTSSETTKVAHEKAYLVHQRFLADEVRDRVGKPQAEPATPAQAQEEVRQAEKRKDATAGIAIADTVEALNPPANASEGEIEKKVKKAERSKKLVKEAVAQSAKAQGNAAPKGDFESLAPMPTEGRGAAVEITQGEESHPAHYYLVKLRGIITSHRWNGNRIEKEPMYRPVGMQKRVFDQPKTEELFGQAGLDKFRLSDLLQAYNGPERGVPILEGGGRAVGGNTRLLRVIKYLENVRRQGGENAEVGVALFRDAMRNFARTVGIDGFPADDDDYVVVRILDNPIRTNEEAVKLGSLFNDPTSSQVDEAVEAVTHGTYLKEADVRERDAGQPGILTEIGKAIAGDGVSTVRQAIDSNPFWFAQVAKDYFHIPDTQNSGWFENTDGGRVLSLSGKDKFELALLSTHIPNAEAVEKIKNTAPAAALAKSIGTITALKGFPDRDLSGKVSEAVQAVVETAPHRAYSSTGEPGDKPGVAWSKAYQIQNLAGIGAETPPEPDIVVRAIYQALLDRKTTRLNAALKDVIGGQKVGMDFLIAPEVDGKQLETPAELFNAAFEPELKEIAKQEQRAKWEVTQDELDAALRNEPYVEQERKDQETKPEERPVIETKETSTAETKGIQPPPRTEATPKFGKPPQTASPEESVERKVTEEKASQGYITPQTFREMLNNFPTTKDHAHSIYEVAGAIAKARWEKAKPEGVERKDALGWLLKEIGFRGIEAGKDKKHRGEYDFATGIMRLNEAADHSTFMHEFFHAIAPLLTEEEWKQIDSIKVNKAEYRRQFGKDWEYTGRTERMEKLSYGAEKFFRDENAVDFQSGFELRKVLKDIKDMFVSVYRAMQGDPLSPFKLGADAKQWFSDTFGITGFNVADNWNDEVKKARAEEKKIRPPQEQPHPVAQLARDLGGTGLREAINGKVVDEIGDRVDPKKNVAVISFPSVEAATLAGTGGVNSGKFKGAEIIEAPDGTVGLKINTAVKPPKSVLHQALPERHPGMQLEDLEKRLRDTPAFKTFERRLLQMQIDNLKSRIRSEAGAEAEPPQRDAELPKQVIQEAKGAKTTDRGRTPNDGKTGLPQPPRTGGIPQPPKLGVSGHAGAERGRATASGAAGRAPVSLADVKPVTLQPLSGVRGDPVGTTIGETFDAKAWVDGLKKAGLPETTPPPTHALDPKTAAQLIYPGQKQVVQTVMSALKEGDGAAIITPPGSGKTYTSTATVKEFLRDNPDARVLMITKNRSLIKKTKRVAANTFGFDVETDAPEGQPGVYAASYMGLLNNSVYKNSKWDLVIADESGEARRWYDEDTKQGQMLRDVINNSRKAVYMSATPFHSPMEYGYLDKLNLWPKGQFDKWIQENFAHEKVGDKIIARLDPGKQAKLRAQLIERGQFISQAISYEGYNAHFGVVPVTDAMKRGLDRIREGFSRARDQFVRQGKPGLAKKVAAFEAVYTKNFLERERLPQAIELARKAREQGWRVLFFSEHTADDLFRRERIEGEEASTYQQLDDAMGGQLSRIIPPYPSIFNQLYAEFGDQVGDYSGAGNTDAAREKARTDFLKGEISMLYASYAGGGIGVDMHDADFPELGIKGGDKPIVAIYLGPPYSGVLLEQAMGRPWRFGVKSDVHAVFLATDSEPDIRLMQTKVGPRMKALRAAVLGEKDSLANVMSTYTDEEKVRERQDQLAYDEGNEMKVNATQFQVRSKSRSVGIQDWSAINFPHANEAKNRGMKYGEDVPGGDWSTLYQSKNDPFGPPPKPEDAKVDKAINNVAENAAQNPNIPRDVIGTGAASAKEVADVAPSGEIDKAAAGRQAMEGELNSAGFFQDPETGAWKFYHALAKKLMGENAPTDIDRALSDFHTYTLTSAGMGLDQRLLSTGRAIKAEPQIRAVVNRFNDYEQTMEGHRGRINEDLFGVFQKSGMDFKDPATFHLFVDVLEGKRSTTNEAVNKAVRLASEWYADQHDVLAEKKVPITLKSGEQGTYADVPKNPRYFNHITDWDMKLMDPETGETKTLREITDDRTLSDVEKLKYFEKERRELGADEKTAKEWLEELKRDRKTVHGPWNPNITKRRLMHHPFYHRDVWAMHAYANQVASAVTTEEVFGTDLHKIRQDIANIPNRQIRRDLIGTLASKFERQDWNTIAGQIVRKGQTFETLTKMPLSVLKVGFHGAHTFMALSKVGSHAAPEFKALFRWARNPEKFMLEKYYTGVISRQTNPFLLEGHQHPLASQVFKLTGFDGIYRWVRALSGEAAKVWLEQGALDALKKGGKKGEAARRLLKNTMLIGDEAIDRAIATGRFDPDSIDRAERSFANTTTFSQNPLQMPKTSRMSLDADDESVNRNLHAALRGLYSLQSFSIKTYSFEREHFYEEVFVHRNFRPLIPFFLHYPAAGLALMGIGAGAISGLGRAAERITGLVRGKPVKHQNDRLDTLLEMFNDVKHHPWLGVLRIYIDAQLTTMAMERAKRNVDLMFTVAMGMEDRREHRIQAAKKREKQAKQSLDYYAKDELDQDVGPIWGELAKFGFRSAKEVKDLIYPPRGTTRWGSTKTNTSQEIEDVTPLSKVVTPLNESAHPKNYMTRPPQ